MRRSAGPLILIALAAVLTVAGCSAGSSVSVGGTVREVPASEAVQIIDERTVIDVRTPAEFAAAHVVGALNVDVEAAGFEERIAALDKDAPYLLYCRSGRRSAMAAQAMAKAGFTDIIDAGALEDLAVAGAPIE